MNIKSQLEIIFKKLLSDNTDFKVALMENEDNDRLGYPRIEFQILEINLNQENMSIDPVNDDVGLNIVDNYNRTSRYMLDFTFIHKSDEDDDIDKVVKLLSNYYKMDNYFYNLDYTKYEDIEDITLNHDFKSDNKNMFYSDQSINRDNYTVTFDVEIIEKDIIPMGVYMKRGEFIE